MSPNVASAEIKAAYRTLAARYHPDKHRDNVLEDLAREKLAEINAAYTVLKDDRLRAAYDRERQGGGNPAGHANGGGAGSGSGPRNVPDPATAMRSVIRLVAIAAVVFFALRFVRSPRALLVIGIAILVAWFLPRVWKRFRRRR